MSDLMDIVIDCENQLGLSGPPGVPPWRARVIEVGRLRAALNQRPLITPADLRLAIVWCKRRREPITSTLQLFAKIDDARRARVEDRASIMTITHREAMAWEQTHPDTDSERWLARLVRAFGPGRANILEEWKAAGRGPALL